MPFSIRSGRSRAAAPAASHHVATAATGTESAPESPASVSRAPRDDEIYVLDMYQRHATRCSFCRDAVVTLRHGETLCTQGRGLACDVAQYFYLRRQRPISTSSMSSLEDDEDAACEATAATAYSLVDRDRLPNGPAVIIDIPAEYPAVRQLLRALARGLRLSRPRQRPHSPSPSTSFSAGSSTAAFATRTSTTLASGLVASGLVASGLVASGLRGASSSASALASTSAISSARTASAPSKISSKTASTLDTSRWGTRRTQSALSTPESWSQRRDSSTGRRTSVSSDETSTSKTKSRTAKPVYYRVRGQQGVFRHS